MVTDGRSVDRDAVLPLTGPRSLDPLVERIGDARYVLLGEASHGTSEFYRWRAELTRRLIDEEGFSFVAVEGDWPDCQALHCSVVGAPGAPEDPREALEGFRRWPRWMWANTDVLEFARWLRERNLRLPEQQRAGFFGLDVYSLWESLYAVLGWLRENMPEQVEPALRAYRCFEPYGEDPRSYAQATRLVPESCEREVVDLLAGLRRQVGGPTDEGLADFAARQNAEVLAGAEQYYRSMVRGGPESWNVRDHHMTDTLDRLMEHHGPGARAVVWEHNTHVGDARATDMSAAGMVNVGQLVRERHGDDGVVLIGFGTYEGRVVAGRSWGATPEPMPVPAARDGSVEALLHGSLDGDAGLLVLTGEEANDPFADEILPHRAIGVVYHPGRDRYGNYVPTVLGERYDAFVFVDHTRALTPLHSVEADSGEEETWPTGL
ncbi:MULTISPECIES: erythromycin esterase family protein [Nocardiopsis]|uniref:Erythromycin esterase-like protein n=1 Tax=Nocardiopsis sinuspersici TaxID=501010 RepID=A0A7Y9XH93_9ACTN|nr:MULTISPECIES: erythromycin esterase family protein [Nocardiopsis]NYH54508.1 erythromycin esterase-like protein [Nocardiopsis sinuspersici]